MSLIFLLYLIGFLPTVGQISTDSLDIKGLTRQGFSFSIGLGGALVSSNHSFDADDMKGSDFAQTNLGISYSLMLGYPVNTHWVIHYLGQASRVREKVLDGIFKQDRKLTYSLHGLGVTYYSRESSPSPYYRATLGLARRYDRDLNEVYGEGLGFSLGTGYQFSNRWTVGADIIYGTLDTTIDYLPSGQTQLWSCQLKVHYLWFKNYRDARRKRIVKTFGGE